MDSNSTDSSPFPPPAPPLAAISPTDQTGVVLIGTALSLIFSMVSMLIRLYIRFQLRHDFSFDDTASLVAVALFTIQSSLVFAQASNGFGKTLGDISDAGLIELQKDGFAADLLYIIIIWLTKCSIAFLYIRLSPYRRHVVSSQVCLVLSTALMIASVLMISLRCDFVSPWIFIGNNCSGLFWRWETIAAFDIAIELALFAIAVHMTQSLQLKFDKKFIVISAFSLRLLVLAPTIARLRYLSIEFASDDPTLDGVLASSCTQIQLSYAIIATTTPCLRPFMSALNTHYGGPTEARTPSGSKLSNSNSNSKTTGNSANEYPLAQLASRPTANQPEARTEALARADHGNSGGESDALPPPPRTRWDRVDYRVAVMSGDLLDQRSLASNESQRMIISKNTEWQVEFRDQDQQSNKST